MRPAWHIASGVILGGAVLAVTKDWLAAGTACGTSFLLDLDHAAEHVMRSHKPFCPKTFLHPLNSLDWPRVGFFLHSYELLALLLLIAAFFHHPVIWALATAVGVHLILDEIGNRLPGSPADMSPWFYFLSYRLKHRFAAQRLLRPRGGIGEADNLHEEFPHWIDGLGALRLREVAWVVVGASRGLGGELVTHLLDAGVPRVVGIARSAPESIPTCAEWQETGRYTHLSLNISDASATPRIRQALEDIGQRPVAVIYNAALFHLDVTESGELDMDAYSAVHGVGVDGFRHVLETVQEHLLEHGGILAGISSINALKPPVLAPLVSYPATKAYMHMALRCLAIAWSGRVGVATLHLGHIGHANANPNLLERLLVPSYAQTARWILQSLGRRRIPREATYPWPYRLTYGGILKLMPDPVYHYVLSHGLAGARRFLRRAIRKPHP